MADALGGTSHGTAHGTTTVIVSHRLGALRHADRIIVVDGGRVTEDGAFDELRQKRGGYIAGMHAMQGGG